MGGTGRRLEGRRWKTLIRFKSKVVFLPRSLLVSEPWSIVAVSHCGYSFHQVAHSSVSYWALATPFPPFVTSGLVVVVVVRPCAFVGFLDPKKSPFEKWPIYFSKSQVMWLLFPAWALSNRGIVPQAFGLCWKGWISKENLCIVRKGDENG